MRAVGRAGLRGENFPLMFTASRPVRVFVSEFVCGGGLEGSSLPDSLLREGRAMLWAVVDDLLQVAGCQVVTTLDRRLAHEAQDRRTSRCQIAIVTSVDEEQRLFEESAASSDAVLVIAPETDGLLADRVRRVLTLGVTTLNCSPEAIELCGDKLRLARHCEDRGLATLPTQMIDWSSSPLPSVGSSEWVIKPRDGAGSWLMFRVRTDSLEDWQRAETAFAWSGIPGKALIQPFVRGWPLSVGCHCQPNGEIEIFPIGEQRLSKDFAYLGGSIPAALPLATETAVRDLVQRTCATISGLNGHIGFDLLLPEADPTRPLLVEINPRLTTSYVGYRRLSKSNLAERWLRCAGLLSDSKLAPQPSSALKWPARRIDFDAHGHVRSSDVS